MLSQKLGSIFWYVSSDLEEILLESESITSNILNKNPSDEVFIAYLYFKASEYYSVVRILLLTHIA